MNKRIVNRTATTNIVRVIATYRVDSKNTSEAIGKMSDYLTQRELPKNIRMVGKAEVLGLRGLL